jgi:hypothetical protein
MTVQQKLLKKKMGLLEMEVPLKLATYIVSCQMK